MTDPYDYIGVVIGIALAVSFAVFFYRVGEFEYEKGYVLGLASLSISLVACFWLNQGAFGVVIGQILLFSGMWVYNLRNNRR